MKKTDIFIVISIAVAVGMLSSCMSAADADKNSVYNWDDYSTVTYDYVRNKDDASRKKMAKQYNKIMKLNSGEESSQQVPPGIYADYGYMLVEDGKEEEGLEYLRKEIELYPMSEPFLKKIIERIEDNNSGGAYDEK